MPARKCSPSIEYRGASPAADSRTDKPRSCATKLAGRLGEFDTITAEADSRVGGDAKSILRRIDGDLSRVVAIFSPSPIDSRRGGQSAFAHPTANVDAVDAVGSPAGPAPASECTHVGLLVYCEIIC